MISKAIATLAFEPYTFSNDLMLAGKSLHHGLNSLKLGDWSFLRADNRQFAPINQKTALRLGEAVQPHGATSEQIPISGRPSLGNVPTRMVREVSSLSGINVRMTAERSDSITGKRKVIPPDGLQAVVNQIHLFQDSLNEADADVLGDVPPSPQTAKRAIAFVLKASHAYLRSTGLTPPVPAVSPGPDGSVDIIWRSPKRVLAANIPEEPDNIVTLYGRDIEGVEPKLSTEFDPTSDGYWALAWLTR